MHGHPVATDRAARAREGRAAALGAPGGGRGPRGRSGPSGWRRSSRRRSCATASTGPSRRSCSRPRSGRRTRIPLHPKVTCITRLEHEVDGLRIPGTRWGIDNPDSIYRVIPISGDERYEIRGPRRRAPDDRELLHPLGRQHGHRGPAQRPRPRHRGRRLVRGHRRRRPGRRSPEPRAVDAEGARVLHPRRHARLGRRRPQLAGDRPPRAGAVDARRSPTTSRRSGPPSTCASSPTSATACRRA